MQSLEVRQGATISSAPEILNCGLVMEESVPGGEALSLPPKRCHRDAPLLRV